MNGPPRFSDDQLSALTRELAAAISGELCGPVSQTAADLNSAQLCHAIDAVLRETVESVVGSFRDSRSAAAERERQFCEGMEAVHAAVKSLVESHRTLSGRVLRELGRIRAECDAVLASNASAQRAAQARAYQLKIQKLELDRLRSRQAVEFEAVERDAEELAVMSAQVRVLAAPAADVNALQQLMIELRELQAHLEDHAYGELAALTGIAGRELGTGIEELSSDVMELHLELEQWGRRRAEPAQAMRGRRGQLSLADVAMEKLLLMRKQREAAAAEVPVRRRQ
jgi:hypothetical protein